MPGVNKTTTAENSATLPLTGTEYIRGVQSGGNVKFQVQDILANGYQSPLTTKGDIVTFGTTVTRQPVGANGTQIVADSSQSTGWKWFDAVGAALTSLAASAGSSLIGFIQLATGAILRTLQSKVREIQSVTFEDFGAVGDGVTDDTAAMQAAINWVCRQNTLTPGTGGARLWITAKKFRFTDTLYFGTGFVCDGSWGGGYPFPALSNPNIQTSILLADFGTNVNRWALDSQTFHSAADGGGRILYNETVSGNIDGTGAGGFNSCHGVSIKGFVLVDANGSLQTHVPYGSIRLNGCPNSHVDISIFGFGYGLTYGCSFGSTYKVTSMTNWFGLTMYNANNGISGNGKFDQIVSPAKLTPPAQPSWMPSAAAFTGASFNMNASHATSSKGFISAADQSIGTNGGTHDVTLQYWDDAVFLFNSYGLTFTGPYAEQTAHDVFVSAYSSYTALNAHHFSTLPSTCMGDFGYQSIAEINVGGNNSASAFARNVWGSASAADPTYILVHNTSNGGGVLPATPRMNKLYEEGTWTPTVASAGGAITAVGSVSGSYTKVGREVILHLDCTITTNGTGSGAVVISGLPYPCRGVFSVGSGREVGVSGKQLTVVANPGASTATCFLYDGTYPGANGARLVGTLTYPI